MLSDLPCLHEGSEMPAANVFRLISIWFFTLQSSVPLQRGSPHASKKEDKANAKCVKYLVVTVNANQHFTFVKANWTSEWDNGMFSKKTSALHVNTESVSGHNEGQSHFQWASPNQNRCGYYESTLCLWCPNFCSQDNRKQLVKQQSSEKRHTLD